MELLKIKKTKELVTITFDNRYKQIYWPAGFCILAEITPEEVIETINDQEKYHGFSKLIADLYRSGVRDKGILKDVASFIKREYPNNQINWEVVDGWLKK